MSIRQHPSLLFRLPRELRDEIYAYYVSEAEGLSYDFATRKLRFGSGRKLDLMYTCKAAASEMKGLALRFNTITFMSSCDEPGEDSFRGLRSISSRFEHLLHSARWTKMVMLHYVAEMVTDDILARAVQAYPSIGSVFRSAFRAIRRGSDFCGMCKTDHMAQDVFTTSFCDAIQYTLDQVATHPNFDALAGKACGLPTHYQGLRSPFLEGTHRKVLDWRPKPWAIPSVRELHAMEQLLTPVTPNQWDWTREYGLVKLYFSATAICIDALSRLQQDIRMDICSIVLQEEARSISNPEAHAEGLIPFCVENTRLRVRMQAGFSTNLAPSFWARSGAVTSGSSFATRSIVHDYTRIFIEWLIRLAALPSRGMPSASFVVDIDARSDGAAHIWKSTIKAATIRANLPDTVADIEDRNGTSRSVLTRMFSLIWRLPIQLSSVIEDIANQTSPVRLILRNAELSPVAVMPENYAIWTLFDWMRNYHPTLEFINVPGNPEAYFQKHFVGFEQSL